MRRESLREMAVLWTVLSVVTALVAVALSVVGALLLYRVVRAPKPSARLPASNISLIYGPMAAGKTALFYYLKDGIHVETHTSMKENVAALPLGAGGKNVTLVDFPGHERLRPRLETLIAGRRLHSVTFLVDSSNVERSIEAAGECLYNLCLIEAVQRAPPPLLVVAAKSEMPQAMMPQQIVARLNAQVAVIHKTRGALADTAGDKDSATLAVAGSRLDLESMGFTAVSVGACSVAKGDVAAVSSFIEAAAM